MAILDRIKYDGDSEWLVYKCPSDQFKLGSMLIVNEGQEALFLKGGKALDLFSPGNHVLKTGNIPLLHKIVNFPYGGDTPFTAEVYYINKTEGLHFKWGTKSPIQLLDPTYNLMLNVRAYGSFGMKIEDSRTFVNSLVGARGQGAVITHAIVKEHIISVINSKIKELISQYFTEKNISVFNITSHLSGLNSTCFEGMSDQFESYGLKLTNFIVESVDTSKEDVENFKKTLEKRSELDLLGREDYYRQRRFDVLDNLAENDGAGGLAAAGMGLGMGLGAGTVAGQAFGGIAAEINEQPVGIAPIAPLPPLNNRNPGATGNLVCGSCSHTNSANSKFCANCGQVLQLPKKNCYSCSTQLDADAKFCNNCGANQQSKVCKSCNTVNDIASKFCNNCGTSV